MLTKLISTSIIAGAFLVGCGGETKEQNLQDVSMPHQIDMTPKNSREFDPEGEEYLHFMKTYNLNSTIFQIYPFRNIWETTLKVERNVDLKYVYYYDIDHNKESGYYDKWIPKVGADYLYENGTLYRYTGTPGTHQWSWEAVTNREDINQFKSYIHNLSMLAYGVTLNQDWSQNSFLGYYDTTQPYEEIFPLYKKFGENTMLYKFFYTSDEQDLYFHVKNTQGTNYPLGKNNKLNENAKYYNYTFTSNGSKYHIQGNKLFNEAWEILDDNLLYETREYEVITIIPKRYLEDGDVKLINVSIRDNDWNELYSYVDANLYEEFIAKKALEDMRGRVVGDGYNISNEASSAIKVENELFLNWSNNEFFNLSLYSVDGTTVNFVKHIVYNNNNIFDTQIKQDRKVTVKNVRADYIVSIEPPEGVPNYNNIIKRFLIQGDGDFVVDVTSCALKDSEMIPIFFRPKQTAIESIHGHMGNIMSEKTFDFQMPDYNGEPKNEIEGDVLTFKYYKFINPREGSIHTGTVKYDISNSVDIKLISAEIL